MNGLLQDLRYAVRQLRKAPGFTLTAILTLALGMCASLAIFGLLDAALIQPLPYLNPDRLLEATESVALIPRASVSYYDYLDWKRLNRAFSSLEIYQQSGVRRRSSCGTEPVHAACLSDANLIRGPLLGVRSGDAATRVSTAGILRFASLAASYIPARRAAKIDPMVALGYE